MVVAVTESSPVAGPSVLGVIPLPADLSNIGIVPLDVPTVTGGDTSVPATASATVAVATLPEEDLDVPLAILAAELAAGVSTREDVRGSDEIIETAETHVGEARLPHFGDENRGDERLVDKASIAGAQQTESPRFSAYLPDFERAFVSRTSSPTVRRG